MKIDWRTVVVSVVMAALLAAVVLAQQNGAEPVDEAENVLTVAGRAELRVKPDVATVSLGIARRDRSAKKAQSDANAAMAATIAAIKKLGVAEAQIQTSSLSLTPLYGETRSGSTRLPPIVGYDARHDIRVRVEDLEQVGAVLDAALTNDANRLRGLSFGLKDPEQARRDALAAATRDAQSKAEAMAQALNVQLVGIVEIADDAARQPAYSAAYSGYAIEGYEKSRAYRAEAEVAPGELTLDASVTARYRIPRR